MKFSPTDGAISWTRQPGTSSDDVAYSLGVGPQGNVYVAGYTGGGLNGNTNQGSNDIFLAKYSPEGTMLWTKQPGTAGDDQARSLVIDSIGDAFVAGYTEGELDGNQNQGGRDLFLMKYSADGEKQ